MRRVLPLLATLLAFAFAFAGCGDDTLTAQQLHARASAICARTAAATDRIAVPSTPGQGGRFLRGGLARMRPAAAQLGELKPPQRLRARYARAVRLADRELALIAAHERAIRRGEDVIDTYRRLDRALAPLVRAQNAAWRGLGVPACVWR
ncbi:MAG: hypothetical protein ACTHOE_09955 [Conexibacter sp.]